jgi:hypothetical protein
MNKELIKYVQKHNMSHLKKRSLVYRFTARIRSLFDNINVTKKK